MYQNKTKQTLLSGVGKMTLLVHSLFNEKKFTHKHYPMVLWAKSVYYNFFKNKKHTWNLKKT